MNKNTKTALIVALSIFGAGVLIWLCVSLSVGFNYSKLSFASGTGKSSETAEDASFKAEHIDKDIVENGQNIIFNLSSADVTVEPSSDGRIHLSYNNTEDTYFEFKETDGTISLIQKQKSDSIIGFVVINNIAKNQVVLSLPAEREGELNINGASSEISISDVSIAADMNIFGVSGSVTIEECKCATLDTGTASGDIKIASVETSRVNADSVSGTISISEIRQSIPLTIASTSGEVYAENVKTKDLNIETISGKVSLRNISGQKADLSTTSGGVDLDRADFREVKFTTISGDIRGTVAGSAKDYTVYTETVSGSNSLSGNRERGERTLDFTSTSGSFDIKFEK